VLRPSLLWSGSVQLNPCLRVRSGTWQSGKHGTEGEASDEDGSGRRWWRIVVSGIRFRVLRLLGVILSSTIEAGGRDAAEPWATEG
jgi:hypothetical protein